MQILKLGIIEEGIRTLLAMLCQLIYPLISWLYTLFMNISKVNILSSDEVQPIYQRVTLIITIIMVFYVTFEFVKYIVQPDGITDKEKGATKIVYKMIMVVVLIAFVPTIFTGAFKLQTTIVDKGIIGKVIVGQKGTDTSKFGSAFSANIFSMFYYVEDEFKEEKCGDMTCEQLVAMNLSVLSNTGKLTYLTKDLNATKKNVATAIEGDKAEIALIEFTLNGFLAVIVGGIIAYIMALYCVDVGVRWAQMIFLQIIAPIPIIGYLSPKKDGIFQKWCKQCLTTYLDLFIRIAVIYFILLICSILLESRLTGNLLEGIEANGLMTTFIYIALILGVMLFAKKAPKMLQELFPSMGAASGNFGLKAGERVPAMAARTLGAALGGTRALGGLVARGYRRHLRNKKNGAKSLLSKEGRDQWRERQQHNKKARDTKRAVQATNNANKRVSNEQIATAKSKVQKANEEYKNATDPKEKAQKKEALDKAAEEYKGLIQKRNNISQTAKSARHKYAEKRDSVKKAREELAAAEATNDQGKINAAKSKLKQAETEFQLAEKSYTGILNAEGAFGRSVGQQWADIVSSSEQVNKAQELEKEMQNRLDEAIKTGDEKEIQKAQQNYATAQAKTEGAKGNLKEAISINQNVNSGNLKELSNQYQDAVVQIAEDQNTKHGSVVGASLWGAVAGGVTGAVSGAKAKELKDIIPKATEGWKKDIKNIQQISNYEDRGGAIGLKGFVDRTVAQIEKNVIGVDTAYQRVNLETQKIENNIKTLDSSISRVDNVKKEFDATEDRIKSKLSDLSTTMSSERAAEIKKQGTKKLKSGTEFKDLVEIANMSDDERKQHKYRDISKKYQAKAVNAKAISEAASKDAEEKSAKLGINKQAIIDKYKNYNGGSLTQEEQREYQLYQEYQQAQKNAEQKARESVIAEDDAKEVEKLMTRAIYSEMLADSNFETNKDAGYDGVAVESLKRNYNEIKIANQDNQLRTMLQQTLKAEDFAAFVNCKFRDYDQMDAVLVALNNARNALAIQKQTQQDQKNRNESSKATQTKKAADDFAGSGK